MCVPGIPGGNSPDPDHSFSALKLASSSFHITHPLLPDEVLTLVQGLRILPTTIVFFDLIEPPSDCAPLSLHSSSGADSQIPTLPFTMSAVSTSAMNPQGQGSRQSARQTRTNPSRTSKTIGRSSFAFGRGSTTEIPESSPVPHGFYPALTHFTDAITALPREFRRHNSLLKEVDAKAWALEENLLQLLQLSSESQPVPHPPHPAPIAGGVIREDVLPKVRT